MDDAAWATLQSAIRKSAVQQARLSAGSLGGADGKPNDFFGESVALDGDTVLIGAYGDDVGQNYNQGSAFIFTRSGTSWTLQAQLTVDDGADDGEFGYSVALDGDTALVGAWREDIGGNDDQGPAYIFTRSGETWTQQAKLTAGDGSANDQFGVVVALDGDTAIIGASADGVGAHSRQGSAYVFARNGTEWIQQAQLVADDGAANDEFGFAVALEGDTAVVGAWGDDVGGITNQGSAYVFVRSGTAWMQQAHLTGNDGAERDYFGVSFAVSDDTALVGMFGDDIGGSSTHGSAYVFTRSGSLWTLQSKLTDAAGLGNDHFGWTVALSHNVALVGAYWDDAPNAMQGSAYVFTRSGTTWTQQAQLTAEEGEGYEEFGISVALDGDAALVEGLGLTTQVERFRGLLDVHFRERWAVERYARQIGVTAGQLGRLCRDQLGASPLEASNARVLHEAQRSLVYSTLSIKQVAAEQGFDDEAYFGRFFRKHRGCTPTEFRERGRRRLAEAAGRA